MRRFRALTTSERFHSPGVYRSCRSKGQATIWQSVVKPGIPEEVIRLGISYTSMFFGHGRLLWRALPFEDFVPVLEERFRSSWQREKPIIKGARRVWVNLE